MTTPELPSEETERRSAPPFVAAGRVIVYVVVAIAVVVTIWALIQGGERDLWSRQGALAPAQVLTRRSW